MDFPKPHPIEDIVNEAPDADTQSHKKTEHLFRQSIYASFDIFPSSKGAATHIAIFIKELLHLSSETHLFCLGDETMPGLQREGKLWIHRFISKEPHLLNRSRSFSKFIEKRCRHQKLNPDLLHYRDPWSGHPLVDLFPTAKSVYEVNGLPSIEWLCDRPQLHPMIVHKLKRLESSLAQSSTSIICPSQTIADNILKRWGQHREGPQAIPSPLWIPNGAHLPENLSVAEHTTPSENSPFQMIYFGTCKPWQGVDLLLKACSRLLDLPNWKLTLCISNRTKHIKPLLRQARKTGLVERLEWKFKLNRPVLQEELRQSHLSLAPLSLHPRNLLQGCAPLKILESLAMAVPVLSTRLPCVEEWVEHGQQAHLVHPNDVDELERALRQLYASPEKRQDMSLKAREHLKNNFQWTHSTEKLRQLYANIHEQRKSLNKPHHSSPILFSEA